jgi:hypothetical protein
MTCIKTCDEVQNKYENDKGLMPSKTEMYPKGMLLELVHHRELLKSSLNSFTQIDIWSLLNVL